MRTVGRPLGVVGILVGLVLAALLATYWLGGNTVGSAPGDPTSPDPDGTAAVASILRDRAGIDVRTVGEARGLGDVAGATVVVATSRELPEQALTDLADATTDAAAVLLVRPHTSTLTEFAPGVREQGNTSGVLRAGCSGPQSDALNAGEEISGRSRLYRIAPGAHVAGPVCFRQVGGGSLPGAVVTSAIGTGTEGGRRVTVVGNLDMFTNARLTDVDNAAVAIRLLGHARHVVWYTGLAERAAPAAPGEAKPWPPAWLGPLTLAAAGAVAALMLWRGRRLGRLAVEPLPVVVRANETTLARARLYRRAKNPGHAARELQNAARHRLSVALAVPPTADPTALADAAARAGGRRPGDIHELLTRSPRTDAELATLAGELARLEKEVRPHE